MKRLLLVDAYAMIYRAYYAFIKSPRINSKGENVSAVFGFVVTLEDLIKRVKPTHLAVAFDPHGKTFRHEAYEQYKAQRQETPEDIRRAVPVIHSILDAMRIPQLEVAGFEADDVIGTLSRLAADAGIEVFMATPDKDYGQLVSEHVFQFRPRHTGGYEQMGPKEVCTKYGIRNPKQIIDLLSLMGDKVDNIPGCTGVGEKTAVSLLETYGTIENLLAHTDELKGALREKVSSQTEQIRFSYFLATIRTDVPVGFDEEVLLRQEPDWSALTPLYEQLEFRSLLRNAPAKTSAAPVSPAKKTRQEATLDLFATAESAPQEETSSYDTIENRLCSYLLHSELPFNPSVEPDWGALKKDPALWNLYQEVELPLVQVLRDMENAGVRFDTDLLTQAEKQLTAELISLEQRIYELAGTTFNVNSPSQVGDILFDKLHLDPKAKRQKSGKYSTSEEVLLPLRNRHPVIPLILEQRELKKLISTYVSALPSYINPATGKIHTTYHQTVTATGRLSSSHPNLQNLPIRTDRGQLIRQAVIPDTGCLFLSADYSQIELRLMAHCAQDEHMIRAFVEGQDIHAATAAKIFGVPIEEVSKEQRRRAKTANFGIIYGISAFGLSQQLDCPRQEAQQLINGYFEAFPRVAEYIEKQKQFAREHGYVETLFGRRRYLPDILSHNSTVRSFAERNAVNAPIQGTAADIIKIAMVSIHRRFAKEILPQREQPATNDLMIMQVHDELNFNVPVTETDAVRDIVVNEMQNVIHLSVPLIASYGTGKNWLEAH
ncbi:MAG: DNA polymerase I [Paludibacteraceae bacterium]|nr:DNA polymerase I [Paludibacteraceae bacterium]